MTARSVAGFRVAESAFGIGNDVVGRTTGLTGTIVISGGQVTHAVFRIVLAGIKVSGKTEHRSPAVSIPDSR